MLQPSPDSPLPWRKRCVVAGFGGGRKFNVWAIEDANGHPVLSLFHTEDEATADFMVMVANASTDIVWEVDSERAAAQRRRPQPHLVGNTP